MSDRDICAPCSSSQQNVVYTNVAPVEQTTLIPGSSTRDYTKDVRSDIKSTQLVDQNLDSAAQHLVHGRSVHSQPLASSTAARPLSYKELNATGIASEPQVSVTLSEGAYQTGGYTAPIQQPLSSSVLPSSGVIPSSGYSSSQAGILHGTKSTTGGLLHGSSAMPAGSAVGLVEKELDSASRHLSHGATMHGQSSTLPMSSGVLPATSTLPTSGVLPTTGVLPGSSSYLQGSGSSLLPGSRGASGTAGLVEKEIASAERHLHGSGLGGSGLQSSSLTGASTLGSSKLGSTGLVSGAGLQTSQSSQIGSSKLLSSEFERLGVQESCSSCVSAPMTEVCEPATKIVEAPITQVCQPTSTKIIEPVSTVTETIQLHPLESAPVCAPEPIHTTGYIEAAPCPAPVITEQITKPVVPAVATQQVIDRSRVASETAATVYTAPSGHHGGAHSIGEMLSKDRDFPRTAEHTTGIAAPAAGVCPPSTGFSSVAEPMETVQAGHHGGAHSIREMLSKEKDFPNLMQKEGVVVVDSLQQPAAGTTVTPTTEKKGFLSKILPGHHK